jgi:4-amino-4-deoxy-L-arabinose transferase-like glycosyltransferase
MSTAAARPRAISPALVAGLVAIAFAVIVASAMLHTSTTFDEIVFLAVGARGFHTGDFGAVLDHPRLPQYLYGLPAYLSGIVYPPESVLTEGTMPRYPYARELLWGLGNPAERLVMSTRIVAVVLGASTVFATFLLSRRHLGAATALFAAALVAFLPDMLAHAGVAYNDIALTFAFLPGLYALDAAVRRPTPGRVALAALAFALAACVKFSGLILGPIALALLVLEAASGRWRDRAWRRAILAAVPVFLIVAYVTIAAVYLGDWKLAQFVQGLYQNLRDSVGRVSFLLGERYVGGRWYFFPVAFLLKTPVAFHVMILVAAIGAWGAMRTKSWRAWLAHGVRAPAVGVAFFLLGLVTSSLNIGFRHALPMLPPLCILVAQGVEPLWNCGCVWLRAALALVFASFVASTTTHYPYFLSYVSEYVQARPLYETRVY